MNKTKIEYDEYAFCHFPRKGVTVCFARYDYDLVVSVSYTNLKKDNFNRRVGREITKGRLTSHKGYYDFPYVDLAAWELPDNFSISTFSKVFHAEYSKALTGNNFRYVDNSGDFGYILGLIRGMFNDGQIYKKKLKSA